MSGCISTSKALIGFLSSDIPFCNWIFLNYKLEEGERAFDVILLYIARCWCISSVPLLLY